MNKKYFFVCAFFLSMIFIHSENIIKEYVGKDIINIGGLWQSKDRVLSFENEKPEILLKTFYTLWRDGPHEIFQIEDINLLQVNDSLYLDYYVKGKGAWLPVNNIREIKTSFQPKTKKIYAYYFDEDDESMVYEIFYWKVKMPYEEVMINIEDDIKVEKFIQIDDMVYVCVTGRGTKIRNLRKKTVEEVFGDKLVIRYDNYMTIGEPILKKVQK